MSEPKHLSKRRNPKDSSDKIGLSCECESLEGIVLLFYRYYSSQPSIPLNSRSSPSSLLEFHQKLGKKYKVSGKLRISIEGFNVTVAGSKKEMNGWTRELIKDSWSLIGLGMDDFDENDENFLWKEPFRSYFKPTFGCVHVFEGLSVRLTEEVTPLGIKGFVPSEWKSTTPSNKKAKTEENGKEVENFNQSVIYLSPSEFHEFIGKNDKKEMAIIDARNHYESALGYFANAHLPPIRKFSSLPSYLLSPNGPLSVEMPASKASSHNAKTQVKDIVTYCTGGVRCEKLTRWISDNFESTNEKDAKPQVYTLQGGIQAYLDWFDGEIKENRRNHAESLFYGRNYVFDSRGYTGLSLTEGKEEKLVGVCRGCKNPSSGQVGKCSVKNCHLVLVLCDKCIKESNIICCAKCLEDKSNEVKGFCSCELERSTKLKDILK